MKVNLPDFQIGQAEVTWALWSDVYNWAIKNRYKFANKGTSAGPDTPVANVSLYDVFVWLNAYSQFSGKVPVYWRGGKIVIKDATDENAFKYYNLVIKEVDGYRLPTETEWTIAARWGGTKKPTIPALAALFTKGKDGRPYYWLPENHASGATQDVDNVEETARVAWFYQKSAQKVCTKAKNVLNICDMSGNVREWLYRPEYFESEVVLGGGWKNFYAISMATDTAVGSFDRVQATYFEEDIGFRLARNVP